MAKKRTLKQSIKKFEKELGNEIDDAEKWMKARKNFFIKLAWVAGLIIALLIFSHYYLRTGGVGV